MKKLFLFLALSAIATATAADRTLVLPSAVSATATTAPVNVTDLKGQARVIVTAKSYSGNGSSLVTKLQSSPGEARFLSVASTGANGTMLLSGNTTNAKLAASHTATANITLTNVSLPLKRASGLTSGNITLSIEADSTGAPSGTPLAISVVLVATLPISFESVDFAFSPGVNLSANSTYWIVATPNYTANSTVNAQWRVGTVTSAGNYASSNGTAWEATATTNLGLVAKGHVFTDLKTFTTVTTNGSLQITEFPIKNYGTLRLSNTVGGTGSPAFVQSAILVQ